MKIINIIVGIVALFAVILTAPEGVFAFWATVVGCLIVIGLFISFNKVNEISKKEILPISLSITIIQSLIVFVTTGLIATNIGLSEFPLVTCVSGCISLWGSFVLLLFLAIVNGLPKIYYWHVTFISILFILGIFCISTIVAYDWYKYLMISAIIVFIISMIANFICEYREYKKNK